MSSTLFTPELVLQVAEATKDYVITPSELSGIISTATSIFAGVLMVGFIGMLMGAIAKGFTKETGVKMEKRGGILIPV